MTFELHQSSVKAFLVPNHGTVNIKLRSETDVLEEWRYRGFDDSKQFILLTKDSKLRWVPINSVSYIEQIHTDDEIIESHP